MPGSRLPDEGSGAMPRKVAELLRSHEEASGPLDRLSSLVRAKGLSPRVLETILHSSPGASETALVLVCQGVCGQEGREYASIQDAVGGKDADSVWRAAVMAFWAEFVVGALGKTQVDARRVWATGWAMGETAHWVAGKHILDQDETFVTALLLDSGLVALMYALPEVYTAMASSKPDVVLARFERDSFGFDHQAAGAAVLRQFRFAEEVAREAATHHTQHLSLSMTGKALRAATVAVGQVGGDFGLGGEHESLDKAILEGALLKPEHEAGLLEVARASLARAHGFRLTGGAQAA